MASKKRVMFVLGYPKEHMVMPTADGGAVLHYWGTEAGQQLWQKLFNAIPQGSTFNMGTDMEVFVDFAYGYVPKVTKRNRNNLYNKYLEPKVGELKEYKPTLLQNIETFQPDIIVPMHSLATKQIMGSSQITQVRGKPEKIKFGNHECWVLSTFSMDAVQVVKKNEPLQDIDLNLIMRFLAEGESTFISDTVKYVTLTNNDYDEIIRLLSNLVAKKDANVIENAVAWDLETNTLRPEYSGSKILTFSFSDDHAVGYTLPVDHPEQPWTEGQRNTIMDYIFQFIRSDIYKVGANIQFDMKYTKMKCPEYLLCKNNLDVQAGFYIAVSQDSEATKSLKTLVYYYTDMGGYDAPVDGYKHFFKKVRTEIKKRYNKRDKKPEEYQAYLDNGLSALGLKTPDYMNEDDVAVMLNTINKLIEEQGIDFTNPVDGEDFTYEWIPYRLLAEYASGDVDATRRINVRMVHDEVSKYDKWVTLYKEHYPELMNTLADMEVNGMQVDENRLLEIKEAFKLKQEEIYKTVQSHALVKQLEEWKEQEYMEGLAEKAKKPADRDPEIYKKYTKYRKEEDRKLNINSPTDKGMLMFMLTGYTLEPTKETLKDSAFKNIRDGVLKKSDVNWTHFKTDSDNVERLMEEYGDFELGKLLLEYGKATKLVTTYTQGILDITDDDNVVHGSIKSTRTATTRLAISSPSLQNIPRHIGDPRRYDYRYPIKSYYVPTKKDNHDVLILLDYSAQELRVASLLAKDEDMQRAFLEGKDVHKETASIAFGVPIDEVTSDLRSDAKAVSFGLLYGEDPNSYSAKNDMTVQEAEALFDKYFEGKPLFKSLIEDSKNLAILNKYTEIPESGFRRLLLDVDSNDTSKRNEALRQALNTQIQGFSAYLMQKALIKMNTYFQENNVDAKIIVSVHDSVAISTRKELADEVGALCKGFMETLDMDILNVTIDGKPTYFTMEADFGVAINYNNECPYVKEEFETAVSAEGYCSYYTAEEHIGNLADVGLITAEQKEQMLEVHEAWKPYYMNAETLQSNADLYAYHDYTMRYRGVEGIFEGV